MSNEIGKEYPSTGMWASVIEVSGILTFSSEANILIEGGLS